MLVLHAIPRHFRRSQGTRKGAGETVLSPLSKCRPARGPCLACPLHPAEPRRSLRHRWKHILLVGGRRALAVGCCSYGHRWHCHHHCRRCRLFRTGRQLPSRCVRCRPVGWLLLSTFMSTPATVSGVHIHGGGFARSLRGVGVGLGLRAAVSQFEVEYAGNIYFVHFREGVWSPFAILRCQRLQPQLGSHL